MCVCDIFTINDLCSLSPWHQDLVIFIGTGALGAPDLRSMGKFVDVYRKSEVDMVLPHKFS